MTPARRRRERNIFRELVRKGLREMAEAQQKVEAVERSARSIPTRSSTA
jgi:hypothetical protein